MAMKWTTYLAVEETERQKKGTKKGQKNEMKYSQLGQEERQIVRVTLILKEILLVTKELEPDI